MAVPTTITDLSTTAASNSPAGSESIGTSLDDYIRSVQAIIKQGVSKGSDITAASTITPVATSSYFVVTGNTGITAIGETYSWVGRTVVLKFSGTPILTHSAGLILPGAANITTVAGDVLAFVNESAGVWRCIFGNNGLLFTGGNLTGGINSARGNITQHATTMDFFAVASPDILDGTGSAVTITACVNAPQAGATRKFYPIVATVLTHGATFDIAGNANLTASAGDCWIIEAKTVSTYRVTAVKEDGTAVVAASSGAQIQPISASVAGNALTITAPSLNLDFRSATLTSGTVTTVTGDPADLVVSSGSTLGTVANVASRLAIIAMNNAGTIELAVRNVTAGANLDETGLISTTAEGGAGAADSATVNYSTTARSNLAYRVIGYVESTQATPGTWVTAPSTIQGEGGNAHAVPTVELSPPVSASGVSVDFTGIPAFTKSITLGFLGLSTNGGADLLIQIGPVGGVETSGYLSSSSGCAGGVASVNSTAGFISYVDAASSLQQGFAKLELLDPSTNTWAFSTNLGNSDAARTVVSGGVKGIAGMLERVRITTVGGTETLDAGSLSIKTSQT